LETITREYPSVQPDIRHRAVMLMTFEIPPFPNLIERREKELQTLHACVPAMETLDFKSYLIEFWIELYNIEHYHHTHKIDAAKKRKREPDPSAASKTSTPSQNHGPPKKIPRTVANSKVTENKTQPSLSDQSSFAGNGQSISPSTSIPKRDLAPIPPVQVCLNNTVERSLSISDINPAVGSAIKGFLRDRLISVEQLSSLHKYHAANNHLTQDDGGGKKGECTKCQCRLEGGK
jgi:hypothetical protein